MAVAFISSWHNRSLGVARSNHELSQSTAHHSMASTHTWPDVVLVAAGVIAVVVTTFYTLLYLIRPGKRARRTSNAAFWRTDARDPDDRGTAARYRRSQAA